MTPITLKNRYERTLVVFATVTILRCLVYPDTFSVPFVFDDIPAIVENPFVRDLSPPEDPRSALSSVNASYNREAASSFPGMPDRTIQDLAKATEIGPWFAGAYYDRGVFPDQGGRFAEAVEDRQRVCSPGRESGCESVRSLRGAK